MEGTLEMDRTTDRALRLPRGRPAPTTASAHEPARHSKRSQGAPRAALLTFLVLALVSAGAGVVVRGARAEAPPVTTSTPAATTTVGAAFRLGARVTASPGTARFSISSTQVPARAVLTLDPAGSAAVREVRVDLSTVATEVVLRGLRTGTARWTLRADGTVPLRGELTIPGKRRTTGPPTPAAGPRNGSAPGVADAAPTAGPAMPRPVRKPVPSTPRPSTAGTAPSAPSPSPTPRPTGPASPYDPDDH